MVLHIGLEEAVLLFGCRIPISAKSVRFRRVVIVVAPLGEVICKFEARDVC